MRTQILIVDDSPEKTERILDVLHELSVELDFEPSATIAKSVSHASAELRVMRFDLLILDLLIPLRSDSDPLDRGGLELLRKLERTERLITPGHIIALTAFPDARDQQVPEFERSGVLVIPFSQTSDEWVSRVSASVRHVVRSKRSDFVYRTDLAIVTALYKIELEAVLNHPGIAFVLDSTPEDCTPYFVGKLRAKGEETISVVAASAPEMGMSATAVVASKMIERYRPRYLCMLGIAAGRKGKFGDILIASASWDYGAGKRELRSSEKGDDSIFLPRPSYRQGGAGVMGLLQSFSLQDADVRTQLRANWSGDAPSAPPEVFLGPLASGAAVIADRRVVDEIQGRDDKLIGVDMEVHGLFQAACWSSQPSPEVFAMKSVCDFGDSGKGDQYQAYAAYTSVGYCLEFAARFMRPISSILPVKCVPA